MFNPDDHIPKPNRALIYFGACIIAGMRLARERQVNTRLIPTRNGIEESVDLAHEIFNRVPCIVRPVGQGTGAQPVISVVEDYVPR